MSKILYIGNYRDNTSFGRLCRDYILAILKEGHDVVCRPYIYVQGTPVKIPPEIEACEVKPSKGIKICIQQVPIEDAIVDYRFEKNIFIFSTLRNWKESERASLERFRDCTILTMNDLAYQLFRPYTVNQNIVLQKLPYPTSLVQDAFDAETEKLEFLNTDTFKFYTIGKISIRKNLRKIVEAFALAFSSSDKVDLVIKTSTDIDPKVAGEVIKQGLAQIKTDLGRFSNLSDYKPEIVITGNSEDENLVQLHKSCDCFISVSSAECQNYMAKHARMAGNSVIVPYDFMDKEDTQYTNDVLQLPTYKDYAYVSQKLNLTNYPTTKLDIINDFSVLDLKNLYIQAYQQHQGKPKNKKVYSDTFGKVVNSIL